MECPRCGQTNPPGTKFCEKCKAPLADVTEAPTSAAVDVTEAPTSATADGWSSPSPAKTDEGGLGSLLLLQPGSVLGQRYEILGLLGVGGMGAVYKARDREVDRLVALKVIRRELADNPEILRRFKQELILARQVTHRNVIRIYDLGGAEGVKFISMEYIEGQDLRTTLTQRGKLSPEEAVGIIEQVCRALDAAHSEGVVHRDLKPQNIMVDKQGKVSVMDFGIARSMETPGMTRTGVLLGTPEYMSPQQAKGEEVDARSDLFTLGIIFYELLTGKSPYRAETAYGMLLRRTQERARPPAELDPTIPRFVNDVVMRCLEIDPQRRYQGAAEILHDLEARQAPRRTVTIARLPTELKQAVLSPIGIAAVVLVVILVVAGAVFRGRIHFGPAAKQTAAVQPISVAILPFRNASSDPALDWLGSSLAEMLRGDLGQSSYLHTVSSDRVNQILHDLRITPDSSIDPDTLRRIAEFTSADTLVSGQYARFGEQIRIDATLQDLKHQRTIPLKAEASNEQGLLSAVAELAKSAQQNLALSADVIKELQAKSFRPSSNSVQALRYYNEGLQLARQGKQLEALKKFEASTQEDTEFGLAYSKLAQTYANLGYDNEAENFSRKAVGLSEKLPPPEKYLILANHARITNDNQKAIEAYENVAKVSPEDADVQFNLAGLYQAAGSYDRARDLYARLLSRDPKYVDALLGMGRVEIFGGNPQKGLEYLNRALPLAVELENDEEKAASLQLIGVAYKRLNKLDEALRNYQESLEIKRRLGDKRGMGLSLNEMAQVLNRLGKPEQALRSFQEALQLRREIGDKRGVGDTLIDLGGFYESRGEYDQALALTKQSLQIQHDLGNPKNEALCLNNIGCIYLDKGNYEDAMTYFQQALQLREKLNRSGDIADTLYNLAETSTKMGQYDQALGHYLRATELWRSAGNKWGLAVASYGMGTLFEYQGRYGAALSAREEALKMIQQLQDRGFWMAEILSGYGDALDQIGRADDAQKSLDEALNLARQLKNDALVAETLNYQGDWFFYRGDYKSARAYYERALPLAARTKDRDKILISKFNLSKVAVKDGHPRDAINTLRGLAEEADRLGLKYVSVECAIYLAEALVNTRDYPRARQELDRTLGKSERLGLRTLQAKAHYLLATALRLSGNGAEAARHYRESVRLLEDIQKETGRTKITERADLNPIYKESTRWAKAPNT